MGFLMQTLHKENIIKSKQKFNNGGIHDLISV
jgi:hypothetical protein